MDVIYLGFANSNSKKKKLKTLQKEEKAIYDMLSRRDYKGHFRVIKESHVDLEKLETFFNQNKDHLIGFHYSGHATEDKLELEKDYAMAKGIAKFLSQCPKLKFVFFNGCCTNGHLKYFQALENTPIFIGTYAKVEDGSATHFSINFYRSFCEYYEPIDKAFVMAEAALETYQPSEIKIYKGLFRKNNKRKNSAVWGLYYKSDLYKKMKLPLGSISGEDTKFKPNSILLPELLKAFAQYNEEVKKMLNKKQSDFGHLYDEIDKSKAVLSCLPFPISEQLRKLLTPTHGGSGHIFFDKLDRDRLNQLLITYNTIVELIVFIQFAQIWDHIIDKKKFNLSGYEKECLKFFFNLNEEEKYIYDHWVLIEVLFEIIKKYKVTSFVKELSVLNTSLKKNVSLKKACNFIESVKSQFGEEGIKLEDNELMILCEETEIHLSTLLAYFNFIIKYALLSVKSISVLKYKHDSNPIFNHKIVRLIQRFFALKEDPYPRADFLETTSVLLLKNGHKKTTYLNLSPFIIDQNAFDSESAVGKLYYFFRYERNSDTYAFKHIYKPDEDKLNIKNNEESNFYPIKVQLDYFSNYFH